MGASEGREVVFAGGGGGGERARFEDCEEGLVGDI